MNATDRIMREVESLFALDSDFCGAWAEMLRHTIAHAVGDLERARDAALEERNRLGVELAGARTRIAMRQEQAMHAMAEADDLRAEVERWRTTVGAVMPPDLKCWHQNSPAEWPEVTAHTITALRADRDAGYAEAERMRAELDRYRRDEA